MGPPGSIPWPDRRATAGAADIDAGQRESRGVQTPTASRIQGPAPCPWRRFGKGTRPLVRPDPASSPAYFKRASTSEALWPPNPKLLLITMSRRASRATFGT